MYNINEAYKNHIINSITRKPKSKIVVGDIEYTGVTHLKTFPKIEHNTEEMFGSFPTKTCEFEIYNINADVNLRGKEISAYRGLDIEGDVHWIPVGIFQAESKDITSNLTTKTIKFKGSDRSHLFDVTFNSDLHTYPCNLLDFTKRICANHSIVLEKEDFPFWDFELKKAPEFAEGITEREIIRKIAQLGGCIAQITREGKLKISQPEVADIPITSSKYSSLSRENTVYVTGLALCQSDNEDLSVNDNTHIGEYGEFVYRITDNPFLKDRRSEVINDISSCYIGKSITPFAINGFIDDFIYDLNDFVTVRDKTGVEFQSAILSITTQSRIKSDFKAEFQKESSSSDLMLEGSLKQAVKEAKKNIGSYKTAQEALNTLMSNAMGLYISEKDDGFGGKIYYYHDTNDIANATYIATINSEGFAFTSGSGCWNGGNPIFKNGVTKEGNAILQAIYTHKLSASLIEAGVLKSTDGSVCFDLENAFISLLRKDSKGDTVLDVKVSPNGFVGEVEKVITFKEVTLTDAEIAELESKYTDPLILNLMMTMHRFVKYVALSASGINLTSKDSTYKYRGVIAGNAMVMSQFQENTLISESVYRADGMNVKGLIEGDVVGLGALTNVALNTDMNDLLTLGAFSIRTNVIAETIANLPLKVAGRVFVAGATGTAIADSGSAYWRQTFIPYQLKYPTFEREISRNSSDAWNVGDWIPTSLHGQKILWSGYSQMGNGVTINLTEKISQQPNGITLVFSYVDSTGAAADYYYIHHPIEKSFVAAKTGASCVFHMNMHNYALVGSKLLYIHDEKIIGHADNTTKGTAQSGITYDNSRWMLRYILGR